jgi:hypothetical protein
MLNLARRGRPSCNVAGGEGAATGSFRGVVGAGVGGTRGDRDGVVVAAGLVARGADPPHEVVDTAAATSRAVDVRTLRTTAPPYVRRRTGYYGFSY